MSIAYLHTAETKLLLQVVKDLNRHEGFREYAYPDPLSKLGRKYRGKQYQWGDRSAREIMATIPGARDEDGAPWTYGFGFTKGVTPDSRIDRIRAERMLEQLILDIDSALRNVLTWYKDSTFVTKTVLINMVFNMGLKGFLGFRNTLNFIKLQDYTKAAQNMLLSLWASQVGSRAKELAQRIRKQEIEPHHQAQESIR